MKTPKQTYQKILYTFATFLFLKPLHVGL